MEVFSLLKYWKDGGSGGGGNGRGNTELTGHTATTTIITAVNEDATDGDDGPFFDLEFAVPDDLEEHDEHEEIVQLRQKVEKRETVIKEINEEEGDEVEVVEVMQSLKFSPSDDLLFKGNILKTDDSDAPATKFQPTASLVKSAAKLRVFMLGLKRSKSESSSKTCNNTSKSKLLTVKLRIEDVKVPLISLLTRTPSNSKLKTTEKNGGATTETTTVSEECGESDKRNKKEVLQRYLKMVKLPRKNNQDATVAAETSVTTVDEAVLGGGRKGVSLKAVMAKKHLGKSKSAVVHSLSSNPSNMNETTSSKKRDDSMFQQQEGIQSAILHCKRSFNPSSSSQGGDNTTLTRSTSDPSHVAKALLTVVLQDER